MNETLLKNNFLLVNNFIEKDQAEFLARSFKSFADNENIKEDTQVAGSQAYYNYIPFLRLLIEQTKKMNEIVGLKLLPTCAYSRVYKKGNILKPHTDRPACEFSITLNLSKTHPWPIYIKNPAGDKIDIDLNPGDGVVYLGNTAEHGRDEFNGDEYIQVFLHYVNSSGPFVEHGYEFHNWINNHLLSKLI